MHIGLTEEQWERLNMIIENPLREGVYKIVLELHENAETEFHFWKIRAIRDEVNNEQD